LDNIYDNFYKEHDLQEQLDNQDRIGKQLNVDVNNRPPTDVGRSQGGRRDSSKNKKINDKNKNDKKKIQKKKEKDDDVVSSSEYSSD